MTTTVINYISKSKLYIKMMILLKSLKIYFLFEIDHMVQKFEDMLILARIMWSKSLKIHYLLQNDHIDEKIILRSPML